MGEWIFLTEAPALYWVVGVSILFLLVFILLETKKSNTKRRFSLRTSSSIVMMFSLMLIGLRPAYRTYHNPLEAILLTQEYSSSSFDSLIQIQPELRLFVLSRDDADKYKNALQIPDISYIKRNFPQLKKLHILGQGIEPWDEDFLKGIEINYQPSLIPHGIIDIYYEETLALRDTLKLFIVYNNRGYNNERIELNDPSKQPVDSAKVNTQGVDTLSLKHIPKRTGKNHYELVIMKNKEVVEKESIHIVVNEPRSVKCLIINKSPSFEMKYLKNWLGEQGHSIVLKNRISRAAVNYEYVNAERVTFRHLSKALLNDFDLLFFDRLSWNSIGKSERESISLAVEQNGLGVIINGTSSYGVFAEFDIKNDNKSSFKFIFQEETVRINKLLKYIPNNHLNEVIVSEANKPVVVAKRKGFGLYAINFIRESYHLLLAGKQMHYKALWTEIINKLAKKHVQDFVWTKTKSHISRINEPLRLQLLAGEELPVGNFTAEDKAKSSFFLSEDYFIPNTYFGTIWPNTAGWKLVSDSDSTSGWNTYVYDDTQWNKVAIEKKIRSTKQFSERSTSTEVNLNRSSYYRPISLIWFAISFLLSAAVLWVEPKV